MTAERRGWVVLNDPANTTTTLIAQHAGRLELRCSVCEARVDRPYELDDSGRCEPCRS